MAGWAIFLLTNTTVCFVGAATLPPESPWDPWFIGLGTVSLLAALVLGVMAWVWPKFARSPEEQWGRDVQKMVRKQDRKPGLTRIGVLEHLARNLEIGEFQLDPIKWAGERFQKQWEEFVQTNPTQEEAGEWIEKQWSDDATKESRDWERSVRDSLGKYLDHSFVARFRSDVGLTPTPAPPSLTDDHYVGIWQHHQMRLQRLHQIIQELSAKWSS